MANVSITSWLGLLDWLKTLAGDVEGQAKDFYNRRNTASYWEAQIEDGADEQHLTKRALKITSVSLDALKGLTLVADDGGKAVNLHLSVGDKGHPITYNGAGHDEADVVIKAVPSGGNLFRIHIDTRFMKVTPPGVVRIDLQYPTQG